jgi:hypothetical protein
VTAAPLVWTDCSVWVDDQALTTQSNELTLNLSVEEKEVTTFGGGGFKQRIGGLRDTECDVKGVEDTSAAIDSDAFTNLGVQRVVTLSPTGAATATAYMFRAKNFEHQRLGGIGDVAPFSLKMQGSDGVGLVRGQIAAAKGNVSATGALGSAVNLGAVGASQYLYAALHIFTAATTITVKVQSDDNSGFTSATDVATIGPLTTTGGTWMTRVAGSITDTYYRFNVSAITGTFNVAGAIAIG